VDRLLQNNLAVKIISVALALLLWYQVLGSGGGTVQRVIGGVAVSAHNTSSSLSVGPISPSSVEVTVKGDPRLVDSMSSSSLDAYVNLTGATAGRQTFFVEVSVPRGVTLVQVNPDNVTVVLQPIIERQLPVEITVRGTPAAGFNSGQATASPSLITVRGPASLVDQVAHATVTVEVAGATAPVSVSAAPELVDASGKAVSGILAIPAKVALAVPITRTNPSAIVPIKVQTAGLPATGYAVAGSTATPAEVLVEGPSAVLSKLTSIVAGPVDVSGATKDVTASVPVVLPSGIVSASPNAVKVVVHIAPSP
jgi:YbbR domain-containing protein